MRVLTFLNEKGGVGKTTLATNTAAAFAIRGYRTILIDVDPQGHSTVMMGLKKRGGLYGLIVQEKAWNEVLTTPLTKHWAGEFQNVNDLFLLPGNIETQGIPVVTDPTMLLKERLEELENWADVVIIDTPPTPSALQSMVYVATTDLIYPSQCQSLSLDGLAETVGRLHRLNATRRQLGISEVQLLGVVPTMYQAQTQAHQHGLELIRKHFGTDGLLPTISQRTVWRDREFANKSIYAYAPDSESAVEMDVLVDAIMTRMGVTA